jgi:hypothetical protein
VSDEDLERGLELLEESLVDSEIALTQIQEVRP